MCLQHGNAVVRLEVSRTVRRQARQARHRGFLGLGPAAEITGDICWAGTGQTRRGRSLLAACLLQLLHNLGMIKGKVVRRTVDYMTHRTSQNENRFLSDRAYGYQGFPDIFFKPCNPYHTVLFLEGWDVFIQRIHLIGLILRHSTNLSNYRKPI